MTVNHLVPGSIPGAGAIQIKSPLNTKFLNYIKIIVPKLYHFYNLNSVTNELKVDYIDLLKLIFLQEILYNK